MKNSLAIILRRYFLDLEKGYYLRVRVPLWSTKWYLYIFEEGVTFMGDILFSKWFLFLIKKRPLYLKKVTYQSKLNIR